MNTYYKKDIPWHLQQYFVPAELGTEKTFQEYINKLLNIFDEVKRVLKNDGIVFVNIDDKYVDKGRALIPERFVIRMVERGWINRQDIIWWKTAGMSESAKDRFTHKFEHIYMFSKNRQYWFNELCNRECMSGAELFDIEGEMRLRNMNNKYKGNDTIKKKKYKFSGFAGKMADVWHMNTSNSRLARIAPFSEEFAGRMVKAGCPVEGIVLDPFMGSGTVGVVAMDQGKHYVGIDINGDYVDMAGKRLELKKVLRPLFVGKKEGGYCRNEMGGE